MARPIRTRLLPLSSIFAALVVCGCVTDTGQSVTSASRPDGVISYDPKKECPRLRPQDEKDGHWRRKESCSDGLGVANTPVAAVDIPADSPTVSSSISTSTVTNSDSVTEADDGTDSPTADAPDAPETPLTNGNGVKGGKRGNNGGGNGSEFSSPGQGSGANDDE